ncbi:hypothetical protein [Pyxidicoccus trucidator]|uniref:hypothetical protein n=1 Tax=Pyxidicoccus trucidator TaxID=2709662 RepID=UPI0013D90209|nr:hypothetical protein [Pyxidicoccus trucidator]
MVKFRRFAISFFLLCTALPGLSEAWAVPMEAQDSAPPEAVSVPPLVPAEPAPAPELTPIPDLLSEPLDLREPEPRSGSTMPLALRGLLESLGAGATGAVGGVLGMVALVGVSDCGSEDCLGPILFGALGGAALGLPLGVFAVGRLLGVRGGLGSSYLGMLVGGGGALLASVLINSSIENGDGSVVLLSVPLAAVLGSVVGFELSEDLSPSQSRPEPRRGPSSSPALLLVPSAGTTPHGGFIGGFSGRF